MQDWLELGSIRSSHRMYRSCWIWVVGGGDGPFEFDIESAKVPNKKNKDLLSWNQQYTKGEEWCHFRNL